MEDLEEFKSEKVKQKPQEAVKYHHTETSTKTESLDIHQTLTLSTTNIHNKLSRIKAASSDSIHVWSEHVLSSLQVSSQTFSICPLPRQLYLELYQDYLHYAIAETFLSNRPVALTPIVMNCFEWLVLA